MDFFLSAALTAQNSPELKIHIRNVAQDTAVSYSVRAILFWFFMFSLESFLCKKTNQKSKFFNQFQIIAFLLVESGIFTYGAKENIKNQKSCIVWSREMIFFFILPKGQLISEWLFDVLNFPKSQHKNLMNFWPRI